MFGLGLATNVYIGVEAIDMRKGFEGLHGLRSVMEKRQVEFVATAAEKLLTYAIGRGVEYFDQPAIRSVPIASRT